MSDRNSLAQGGRTPDAAGNKSSASSVLAPAEVATARNFARGIPLSSGERDLLCDSHEVLRAERDALQARSDSFFDTMRAIAVDGLGMSDPWAHDAPNTLPEDWNPPDGKFSVKVAAQRAELTRLRGLIEGIGHEATCASLAYRNDVRTFAGEWLPKVSKVNLGRACNCIQAKVNP